MNRTVKRIYQIWARGLKCHSDEEQRMMWVVEEVYLKLLISPPQK